MTRTPLSSTSVDITVLILYPINNPITINFYNTFRYNSSSILPRRLNE